LALGGLLAAGQGSHLFQASGLCKSAARAGAAGAAGGPASVSRLVGAPYPPAPPSRLPPAGRSGRPQGGRCTGGWRGAGSRRGHSRRRMKTPQVKVPRLVVRPDVPGRRGLVIWGVVVLVLLLVWVAFEWGRGNLGLPGG